MYTCFDIETGPLDDARLRELMPEFKGLPHPGDFDPDEVKTGNIKDEAKKQDKIDAARDRHDKILAEYDTKSEAALEQHFEKFKEKAALSAMTGRVLAIGYKEGDQRRKEHLRQGLTEDAVLLIDQREQLDALEFVVLRSFWEVFGLQHDAGLSLVGHNILAFDLPFLVRRSWMLGVPVPEEVRDRRYWSSVFIDTIDEWRLGDRGLKGCKLDDISAAMGGPTKPEGTTGADFARLYFGKPEERIQALAYLDNDLDMTSFVASKLQIESEE